MSSRSALFVILRSLGVILSAVDVILSAAKDLIVLQIHRKELTLQSRNLEKAGSVAQLDRATDF